LLLAKARLIVLELVRIALLDVAYQVTVRHGTMRCEPLHYQQPSAMLNIVAILLVLTATFSYLNQRFLKWPTTIGVMVIALAVSLAVVGLDELGIATPRGEEHRLLASIDFADVLMQGMLSFLLFAGALHVEINQLRRVGLAGRRAGGARHRALDADHRLRQLVSSFRARHRDPAPLLPALRRADLAYRSDRGLERAQVGARVARRSGLSIWPTGSALFPQRAHEVLVLHRVSAGLG
jgi:hypothetical protein